MFSFSGCRILYQKIQQNTIRNWNPSTLADASESNSRGCDNTKREKTRKTKQNVPLKPHMIELFFALYT